MTEELEVLTMVTGRLEALGIGYMVTGSCATSYYAVPRMTRDIDLVIELSAGDAERFCALFEGDFYLDRDAVRAGDVRNLLQSVPDLDQPYLAQWTERLGLGALYREALGD